MFRASNRYGRKLHPTASRNVQLCDPGGPSASGSSAAIDPQAGGAGAGKDVEGIRGPVLGRGASVDPAGAVVPGAAATSVLLGAKRAPADGSIELQLVVSLVCGPGNR